MNKLKMTRKHQLRLSELITQLIGSEKLERIAKDYRDGNFLRSEQTKDKGKRFCFDVYHHIIKGRQGLSHDIYKYLNDNHIYSFLKHRLDYELSIIKGL